MDEVTIASTAIAAATLIANKLVDVGAGQAAESLWAGVTRIYDASVPDSNATPRGGKPWNGSTPSRKTRVGRGS
jgi:hypothetical protein